MVKETILLIGSSEKNLDMYYATKLQIPDPFVFIQINNRKFIVTGKLEVDRLKKEGKVDEVFCFEDYWDETTFGDGVIAALRVLKDLGSPQNLLIPKDFPYAAGKFLEANGYSLRIKPEPFFEARAIKTPEEIEAITQVQRLVEEVLEKVLEVIQKSRISNDLLYTPDGAELTSGDIKKLINVYLMERDCLAKDTIVACGDDTSEPHNEGSGPLKANSPIIIDIFPRSNKTLYWADITRTVVKGKASPELKKQYQAVLEAQLMALGMIKDGMDGFDINKAVMEFFESKGYRLEETGEKKQGPVHGVGHGLGLDIHEFPPITSKRWILRAGNVVTVEPGLYYSGTGGVRIEDLVAVTKKGFRNLTKFPKEELMEL